MKKQRLAEIFLNTTQYLIDNKSYLELFLLLASLQEIPDKFDIFPKLARFYPELVEIFNSLRADDRLNEILITIKSKDAEEENLWHTMLWLNSEFINQIGCECGKKVFVYSDTHEENYNHHFHKVFRKWAYAHYSEKRRSMLIIPIDEETNL